MSQYCLTCQDFTSSTDTTGNILQLCSQCCNDNFIDDIDLDDESNIEQSIKNHSNCNIVEDISNEFEDIDINKIITQDDPPKELYICQHIHNDEEPEDWNIDEDIIYEMLYDDYVNDDCYFDYYEHFGIDSDDDSIAQEGALEAAMGSS